MPAHAGRNVLIKEGTGNGPWAGECGVENMRTLCVCCHAKVTLHLCGLRSPVFAPISLRVRLCACAHERVRACMHAWLCYCAWRPEADMLPARPRAPVTLSLKPAVTEVSQQQAEHARSDTLQQQSYQQKRHELLGVMRRRHHPEVRMCVVGDGLRAWDGGQVTREQSRDRAEARRLAAKRMQQRAGGDHERQWRRRRTALERGRAAVLRKEERMRATRCRRQERARLGMLRADMRSANRAR